MRRIEKHDSTGFVSFAANAVNDVLNDRIHWQLRALELSFGVKNPKRDMPITAPFNQGAKGFQKAITPKQK